MTSRYLILASRFNDLISKALLSGAQEAFDEAGVRKDDIEVLWAPGCFELPALAARAARSRAFDAVVCLGAVIRGGTPHFDYVAGQAAAGLMQVSVETGVPVIFGVLTTDTEEQALSRCGLKGGNKGADAAKTAVAMTKATRRLVELTEGAAHKENRNR
jgi:6,7-dimethyl-8-ribityllumazine synthase